MIEAVSTVFPVMTGSHAGLQWDMACYRVDVYEKDYQPVYDWLHATFPPGSLVRCVAYGLGGLDVRDGWAIKIVFKRKADADACHRHWLPGEPIHDVKPWGQ